MMRLGMRKNREEGRGKRESREVRNLVRSE